MAKQLTNDELIKLFKDFQKEWPRERIEKMTLPEYNTLGSKDCFCNWIESRLDQWGSFWGGSSFKFGIYEYAKKPKSDTQRDSDNRYAWYTMYGKNRKEVFNNIRQNILTIIDSVQSGDLSKIDAMDIGFGAKWKVAFHYQKDLNHPIIMPIYRRDWLQKISGCDVGTPASKMYAKILADKPTNMSLKEYSDSVGQQLWEETSSTSPQQYFLVGDSFDEGSQLERFIKEGVWEGCGSASVNKLIQSFNVGDILIVKSTFVKGKKIPCTRIKGIAIVQDSPKQIPGEEHYRCRAVYVPNFTSVDFDGPKYGKYRQTVHRCDDKTIIELVKSVLTKAKPSKYKAQIDLLLANHNLILTGAPGTGKTYMAKAIAAEMNAEVGFVQFHPSYDYTDFVEGLRPTSEGSFERKDGIFMDFCREALKNWQNAKKSKQELTAEVQAEQILAEFIADAKAEEKTFKTSANKEFSIVDETNTTIQIYIPSNEKAHHISVSKKDLLCLLTERPNVKDSADSWEFFGRKYRTQQDTYIAPLYQAMKGIKNNATVDDVVLKKFVCIVDEINRGELSKIFGELFYAIDPGYRGEKGRVKTQYQNLMSRDDEFYEGFFVPENVYILGTMNDIDRSVDTMDFAIRRRFAWKEVTCAETEQMLNQLPDNYRQTAVETMHRINAVIEEDDTLGRAYQIGPSYFLKLAEYNGELSSLWKYHIKGVVFEYVRGMHDAEAKLKKIEKAFFGK